MGEEGPLDAAVGPAMFGAGGGEVGEDGPLDATVGTGMFGAGVGEVVEDGPLDTAVGTGMFGAVGEAGGCRGFISRSRVSIVSMPLPGSISSCIEPPSSTRSRSLKASLTNPL